MHTCCYYSSNQDAGFIKTPKDLLFSGVHRTMSNCKPKRASDAYADDITKNYAIISIGLVVIFVPRWMSKHQALCIVSL